MKKLLSFLTGTLIFIVLPMIAWWIFNLEIYFNNIERLLYIIVMMIMNILVIAMIPNEGKGVWEGEKLMKKHKISLRALQIIPVCILIVSPIFDRSQTFSLGEYERIRILGVIFVVLGFVLMNWSAYILGKQFSTDVTIQKEHELIITGPYRRIRHPRYLGIIIFFLWVAWVFNSLISVFLIVILGGFLIRRIYDEEKIMKKEFTKKREIYTKKSRKLLPFIR